MVQDLRAQFQVEGKQTLQAVIDRLRSLVEREQDWKEEVQISISHCFVPGQDTDCGELVAITEIRTEEGEILGICRSCCSVFTVKFEELITD